jgi:uncharacterized OB-fold protein
MPERTIIEPVPSPETETFWEAAKAGRFLLRRCRACGDAHWYPRSICPLCASADTEWIEGSGEGVIYSYSVMRRTDPNYVMAYVTLAEGPTMMTNIVGCDPATLHIGDRVRIAFTPTPGGAALPCFTPVTEAA